MKKILAVLILFFHVPFLSLYASEEVELIPADWNPVLAGDAVMQRLVKVTAPHVKGAHDAEFVCVKDRAYIVENDNDLSPGRGEGVAMFAYFL